ncbi:uronyl 2-sulfotransferase-like [Ptychodera flava]|uniref:uronyl 2-sulfotransferase-like n=1 Tax=Ptychodera flava TaxID=63121 RepID=UPI003969C704
MFPTAQHKHHFLSSFGKFAVPFAIASMVIITRSDAIIPFRNEGHEHRLDANGLDNVFQTRHGNSAQNFANGKQLHPQSRIIYNRVGKCGSRTVLRIIQKLSKRNGFALYDSAIGNQTHMTLEAQVELVNSVSELKAPFLFERHFHYVDFKKFGAIHPVYINIIRDPISRFTSQYYFKRFGDAATERIFKGPAEALNMTINECVLSNNYECGAQKLFYIIPFFCGQDERCRTPSYWALEKAMSNFAERFLFVGFIEELRDTFQVLEKLLPATFEGAVQIHDRTVQLSNISQRTTSRNKVPPTEEVRNIMRERMRHEYEFYTFARNYFSLIKSQLGISP